MTPNPLDTVQTIQDLINVAQTAHHILGSYARKLHMDRDDVTAEKIQALRVQLANALREAHSANAHLDTKARHSIARSLAAHRRADPHCTCNDCLDYTSRISNDAARCPFMPLDSDQRCNLHRGHAGNCDFQTAIDDYTGQPLR